MRNSLNIPLAALSIAPILWVIAGLNGVTAQVPVDYDADDDGLIEIAYLEQLNAIIWDLDGDGKANNPINVDAYSAEFFGAVEGMGCPASGCRGYELTRDLDFEDPKNLFTIFLNVTFGRSNSSSIPAQLHSNTRHPPTTLI